MADKEIKDLPFETASDEEEEDDAITSEDEDQEDSEVEEEMEDEDDDDEMDAKADFEFKMPAPPGIDLANDDGAGVFSSRLPDDVGSTCSTVDTDVSKSSLISGNNIFQIKNKSRRAERYKLLQKEKRKVRIAERKVRQKTREQLGEDAAATAPPITIDNRREKEDTMVGINDQELLLEEDNDEFASYFKNRKLDPKILITTNDRPRAFTSRFVKELHQAIPNSHVWYRRAIPLKKVIESCKARDYTDIIVINQDRKKPNGMIVCHLPDGPTAHFKLTSVKVRKEIKNSTNPTEHKPEIILNNFGTRLGHRIGRMFTSMYPHQPEFRGRQVVTFHNQRDFIFFRQHRYIIRDAKKVGLQEIGPSFTMKLRSLQKGTFDSKYGEFEWIHKPHMMDSSRRKFHL